MNDNTTPMDCAQFEEIVHDLDRSGTDGFALRGSALAHAEGCSRCARQIVEVEALDFSLRALAGRATDWQAPSRVGTALMAAYRRERAAAYRRRMRWQIAALGTAAAFLLVLGFALRHRAERWSGMPCPRQISPRTARRGLMARRRSLRICSKVNPSRLISMILNTRRFSSRCRMPTIPLRPTAGRLSA